MMTMTSPRRRSIEAMRPTRAVTLVMESHAPRRCCCRVGPRRARNDSAFFANNLRDRRETLDNAGPQPILPRAAPFTAFFKRLEAATALMDDQTEGVLADTEGSDAIMDEDFDARQFIGTM